MLTEWGERLCLWRRANHVKALPCLPADPRILQLLTLPSYTMSATSSVFNFRYENGRRYHGYAEGQYPLPNDDVRQPRHSTRKLHQHVMQRPPEMLMTTTRSKWTVWTSNTTP